MILDALVTGLMVVLLMKLWQKIRRPRVWIIDDSESDRMMMKINFRLEDCDVRYFSSPKNIAMKMALTTPDAVLVDYLLTSNVNGDQVFKFCRRNNIPVKLITGYDGDIVGVDPTEVALKSPDEHYFRGLEKWIRKVTA